MPIKLIGIDIDDTLLNSKKELTDATRCALLAASNHGIHIAISTGRALSEFIGLIEQMPMMRYVITCTGSRITDLHTGKDIFRKSMSGNDLRHIYQLIKPFDMLFEVYSDYDGLIHNDAWALEHAGLYYRESMVKVVQETHAPEIDLDDYISAYEGPTDWSCNI